MFEYLIYRGSIVSGNATCVYPVFQYSKRFNKIYYLLMLALEQENTGNETKSLVIHFPYIQIHLLRHYFFFSFSGLLADSASKVTYQFQEFKPQFDKNYSRLKVSLT